MLKSVKPWMMIYRTKFVEILGGKAEEMAFSITVLTKLRGQVS